MSDEFVAVGAIRLRFVFVEIREGRAAAFDRENVQKKT